MPKCGMSSPEVVDADLVEAVEPLPGMPRMEIVYKPISWFKEYATRARTTPQSSAAFA